MLWLLLACRPDPIERPGNESLSELIGDTASDGLPEGPDPYEEGEDRLSLGLFYEGGFSEEILIDDQSVFFYIWTVEGTSIPTFVQIPSYDAVEGMIADELIASDAGWFGGGLSWLQERDLSQWKYMNLSIRSTEEALAGLKIGMGGRYKEGGSCTGSGTRQNWVSLSNYGFVPDGEWHHLQIPLYDFTICLDLEGVSEPFNLLMAPLTSEDSGSSVFFDNLYLTVEQ